jgi:hypothetical protein
MFFPISLSLFILSGITIIALTLAKRFELKKRRALFFLTTIGRADERAKDLHHQLVGIYAGGKDKLIFFFKKELPLKVKKRSITVLTFFKNKIEERLGNIRNSRDINKQDGISEFFKTMGEVERGGGEINDEVYLEEVESVTHKVLSRPIVVESEALSLTTPSKPMKVERKHSRTRKVSASPTKKRVKKVLVSEIN